MTSFDFLVSARLHICSDDERDRQDARAGKLHSMTRCNRSWESLLAGAGLGLFALDGAAIAADIPVRMPVKAPYIQPVFDWTGFYIGAHAGYGRGASSAVLADPATLATGNHFSGVIGGVQAGYNVRLPSGLLLGVEADLSFPNYLNSNSVVSSLTSARSDVTEQWDYVGTARGRIGYSSGPWLAYATGGLALGGRTFSQHAGRRQRREAHQRPARLGCRRRRRICLRAALERAAGISLQPVRKSRRPLPFRNTIFLDAGFPVASRRAEPQGRLAGIEQLDAEDSADRSGIRSLGNSWPDHLSAARLSRLPRALYRPQQPDAGAANAGDLEQQPVPEHAAVGGRRALLQPRTAAGFRVERHRRRRGFPSGEAQKSNFPYPHYNTSRLFLRQTFGFGGEQEELVIGFFAAREQSGCFPPHATGGQIFRTRCLRRQQLCQGHPQGLHELVDLGARRLRLRRRQARADLWRHRGT